jgi:hypothetical protein
MTSVPEPTDDRTVELEGREFCAFGLQNKISCVPVDEVRLSLTALRIHLIHSRRRKICLIASIARCTIVIPCRSCLKDFLKDFDSDHPQYSTAVMVLGYGSTIS